MTHDHRCWVEVDLDCLQNNLLWIRHRIGPERKVMTVVKADAYGHGLKQIAGHLMQNGTDCFGVANLEEAHAIRMIGRDWPVLMLGACLPKEIPQAIQWGVQMTVSSQEEILLIEDVAKKMKRHAEVHLKIDTGMGRLGCSPESAVEIVELLEKISKIRLKGVFTHFADVENHHAFTLEQKKRFRKALRAIAKVSPLPEVVHASNSGTLVYDRSIIGNMVRPGLMVYGVIPPGDRKANVGLVRQIQPALSFHSRVGYLKWVNKGVSLSYGRTFTARKKMQIATVTSGYGDGYPLAASNRASVLIRGQHCPVVGRVTMDQTLVDVTALNEVNEGDQVTLIGRQLEVVISVPELASKTGTIPWHIITSITYRVPRIYRGTSAS
jgi:alanine racemase